MEKKPNTDADTCISMEESIESICFISGSPTTGNIQAKHKKTISSVDVDQEKIHATEPEFAQVAHALSKKLHYIEQNLSEISSVFGQLINDISCHHEHLRYDVSASFDNLERGITSIQQNLDNLKSNFRVSSEDNNDITSKTSALSASSDEKAKLPSKSRWKKTINTVKSVNSIGRNRKVVLLKALSEKPEFKRIPKSEEDKQFICDAIKASAYDPRWCTDGEISDQIDAMDLEKFKANSIIAAKGSEVINIHIVKTGIVDAYKDNEVHSTFESKQTLLHFYCVEVVNNYEIRARTDCELWFIPAALSVQINTYHKRNSRDQIASFFRNVSFSHIFFHLEANHVFPHFEDASRGKRPWRTCR